MLKNLILIACTIIASPALALPVPESTGWLTYFGGGNSIRAS